MGHVTDLSGGRLDKRKIRIAALGAQEQRRHRRVPLRLPGRFLDPVRGEFACALVDVSPGGAKVAAEAPPALGDRVVMLFDGLGRVEGDVVRAGARWFGVHFNTTQRKRDRLGDAITWRFNMERLGLEEDRAAARKPGTGRVKIRLKDGVLIQADLIDVSITGAAFACLERPRVGETISVGDLTGKVTRWLDNGFAVAFDPPRG
jgi:hypothetical protein